MCGAIMDRFSRYSNCGNGNKKSFIKTNRAFFRRSPKIRGLKDFDYVDERSDQNALGGYSEKYCIMADRMYFRDLIEEIQNNPNSSYQTSYTREEIVSGQYPEHFSVYIKQPQDQKSVESDVFSSRILNYLGTPVVYNRRIDKGYPDSWSEMFLMSVDAIRPNEKLVLLSDIVPYEANADIKKFMRYGLKQTLDRIGEFVADYLKYENIVCTAEDIDNYKKFLFVSILGRTMLLGDGDFRNGNAGILLDAKNNSFRPFPNMDMEKAFSSISTTMRFNYLKECYELYPDLYADFVKKMLILVDSEKGQKESNCSKIARRTIRDKEMSKYFVDHLTENAEAIWRETMQIKSLCEGFEGGYKAMEN